MPKLDIDEALIRKLADLLKETGLNEIEYESGPQRIRVNRGQAHGAVLAPAVAGPAALAAPSAPPAAAAEGPPAGAVTSPMVGTAYLAAEAGATPEALRKKLSRALGRISKELGLDEDEPT